MSAYPLPMDDIRELCRRYNVRQLWLVGSAATGDFDPGTSDLDFLVDFGTVPFSGRADCFFGLEKALQEVTGRRIDLIEIGAVRNPFVRASMEQSRVPLYAAA